MPRTRKTSLPVQKPFPLLKLPPEIRNSIWSYVVVKDGKVIFRNHRRQVRFPESRLRSGNPMKLHQEDDERWLSSQLAVAFTCRQFYLEVTPLYYGKNAFFPGESWFAWKYCRTIELFTDAIGPKNASTITELCLYEHFFPIDKYLSLLPGLKRLHFKNPCPWRVGMEKKMTSLAQKHNSLAIVHGGEVWGPEKWELYPADKE